MQSINFIDSKTPGEVIPIVFKFENIVSSISAVSSVSVTLVSGTDGSPSSIISGTATFSGTSVTQAIQNGVDGCIYLIVCNITSGSNIYSLACYLPVVTYK
jgi:hypothetical protein